MRATGLRPILEEMILRWQYSNPYWLWLAAVIIAVDQITKQLVVRHIARFEEIAVNEFLNLTHRHNTGAAFSSFSSLPPWVFIVLGVVVSIGILIWLRRNLYGQLLVAISLCLILGGALGNVIDRATRGYVIDFIDFHVGNWHYAAFNVADMAITVGAVLLLLDMFMNGETETTAKESKNKT